MALATVDYHPTARELAEEFLNMDSDQQAEFFAHCQAITTGLTWSQHGMYGQALWIAKAMPVGSPGAEFLMDMAAPWYTHVLRYVDNHGERERA